MTGFGAGEGPVAGGRRRIAIRPVNHRYFNLAARLPSELSSLEGDLRERLRRDFDRGHLAVQGRWITQPARAEPIGLDLERAKAIVARLRELQSALALSGDVSLEIGRASCRERVEVWGGGGSLRKKERAVRQSR